MRFSQCPAFFNVNGGRLSSVFQFKLLSRDYFTLDSLSIESVTQYSIIFVWTKYNVQFSHLNVHHGFSFVSSITWCDAVQPRRALLASHKSSTCTCNLSYCVDANISNYFTATVFKRPIRLVVNLAATSFEFITNPTCYFLCRHEPRPMYIKKIRLHRLDTFCKQ